MYSIDRTSPTPTDATHSSMSNEVDPPGEPSTPEFNLLLDKLTEILRFRSACRRPSGPSHPTGVYSANTLKRLQSVSSEPLPANADAASTAGACKSSSVHSKPPMSNRSLHQHLNSISNEKKRRLPSLLQRLIDEGNLIKEAVRRLKTDRFSHSFAQHSGTANTPCTPTKASASINIPQPNGSDSGTQVASSPNRGLSWFLTSNMFGASSHSSENGSPLRTCYSSSAHDRAMMEIGIHDG